MSLPMPGLGNTRTPFSSKIIYLGVKSAAAFGVRARRPLGASSGARGAPRARCARARHSAATGCRSRSRRAPAAACRVARAAPRRRAPARPRAPARRAARAHACW
nr:MAG: hypothetical protein [Molluscum contagiosum virus]